MSGDLPFQLLEVVVDESTLDPTLAVVHAGYELRSWRAAALARHILDWVADFALRPAERSHLLTPGRVMETMRRAIRATFGNGRDRGVPGELLLHAVCRQLFGSSTVVHKIYFKTANSDTYKGFDAVHLVHGDSGDLELWLGEAKFYRDPAAAIRAVASDFEAHLTADYLRAEFALIASKVEDDHPHANELERLLHPNTSLDDVFERLTIPVFITYDSPAVAAHGRDCPEFREEIEAEVRRLWLRLKASLPDASTVTVRLFFLPMNDKSSLLEALERELQSWT